MTRQDLSGFKHLKKEIELLTAEIQQLDYEIVSDTVRGSDRDWPYTEHTITITGRDVKGHNAKVKRLKRRLERRKEDLQDKRAEIEDAISKIDDSLLRQIISLRYISGLPWGQVAAHVGGNNSADSVRMQCNRFLKNI